MVGAEVGDETGAGVADLLDGEDDAGLGVVVVVADGDRPREVLDVLLGGRELVEAERVIVDGAAHAAI